MTQVYLLAAGRGRRAGGPKAWRDFKGDPLLKKQLDFLLSRFAPRRIAISIQAEWLSRCVALCESAHWVPVDPDKPPLASLVALIKSSPMRSWSYIYHVDQPVWEPEVWESLYLQSQSGKAQAYAPSFKGRRGHPVLVSPALEQELLTLDCDRDRLDLFLNLRQTTGVPLPFPCVLENWNETAPAAR